MLISFICEVNDFPVHDISGVLELGSTKKRHKQAVFTFMQLDMKLAGQRTIKGHGHGHGVND